MACLRTTGCANSAGENAIAGGRRRRHVDTIGNGRCFGRSTCGGIQCVSLTEDAAGRQPILTTSFVWSMAVRSTTRVTCKRCAASATMDSAAPAAEHDREGWVKIFFAHPLRPPVQIDFHVRKIPVFCTSLPGRQSIRWPTCHLPAAARDGRLLHFNAVMRYLWLDREPQRRNSKPTDRLITIRSAGQRAKTNRCHRGPSEILQSA